MNKNRDRQEIDIIAEMREMIAQGWTMQEAAEKFDLFMERLNGADDLTGDLSKEEILSLWKAANEAQAEEIAEHFDLATRDDLRAYIGSLEDAGIKYSRVRWEEIIEEEAASLESNLSFAEEAAILDALERDGFMDVYVVQEGPRSGIGDYFPEEFEEKAAALDSAEYIWNHLTDSEKKKTTVEVIADGGTGETVWKDGAETQDDKKVSRRIELWHWKDGSGYYCNETFETTPEDMTAADWIAGLDEPFEIDEGEGIEVRIFDNETDELLSHQWM